MKLFIDGNESGQIDFENESKESIVKLVKQHTGDEERIIVFVVTNDGKKLDFHGSNIFETVGVQSDFIDLITATPRELALVSIYDSVILLEKVKKDIKTASGYLITGEFERGMKLFSVTTRDINTVMTMVDKMKKAGLINFVEGRGYDDEFVTKSGKLTEMLLKIEDSISLDDQIATSDILEYELLPVIEKWQDSMPALYKDVMEGTTLH
jgi:hypothetical protein